MCEMLETALYYWRYPGKYVSGTQLVLSNQKTTSGHPNFIMNYNQIILEMILQIFLWVKENPVTTGIIFLRNNPSMSRRGIDQ